MYSTSRWKGCRTYRLRPTFPERPTVFEEWTFSGFNFNRFFCAVGHPEIQWWEVNLPVAWPNPSQPGVGHFL